jgi:hypothetical protein
MIETKKTQVQKLEEDYNFKEEEDGSWSFEYNKKKAFIINLCDPINIKIITPFSMRRKQLSMVSQILYDNMENNMMIKEELAEFIKFSIEIIGNMLDKRKMGSPEYFINMVYNDINLKDDEFLFMSVLTNIISMIDYSTEYQLSKFSESKLEAIHKAYFEIVLKGSTDNYMISDTGKIQTLTRIKEDNPNPEDEYNLAEMTPINREEI